MVLDAKFTKGRRDLRCQKEDIDNPYVGISSAECLNNCWKRGRGDGCFESSHEACNAERRNDGPESKRLLREV
jgi:hypothetical protein